LWNLLKFIRSRSVPIVCAGFPEQ